MGLHIAVNIGILSGMATRIILMWTLRVRKVSQPLHMITSVRLSA